MIDVDVVLPCYQPPNHWQKELLKLHHNLKNHYNLHFIIVLDGTPKSQIQNALNELQTISITCITLPKNFGKGYAIRQGVMHTKAALIIYTDIDLPFTVHSFKSLLQTLVNNEADVVAGIRDVTYYQNRMSASRRVLSKVFRAFITGCMRMPISDTQCGLKGFNSKAKPLFLKTQIKRYLFDFEWIYTLSRQHELRLKPLVVELKQGVNFRRMPLWVLVQELWNLMRIFIKRYFI